MKTQPGCLLKPVEAMKLKGIVTINLASSVDSTIPNDLHVATGTAHRPDWWPFAWPLVFERRTAISVCVHDPVTGRLVMWCDGISNRDAIKNAGERWAGRKGGMVDICKLIFCDIWDAKA